MEFAIILPVLVTTYLGMVQLAQGVITDRKVTLLARTLADLTAQAQQITDTELSNIFTASRYVMQPVDPVPAKMSIISVYIDKDGKVVKCWDEESGGAVLPTTVTLPPALVVPGSSLIIATVTYSFDAAAKLIPGAIELEEKIYMRPRVPPQVTRVKSNGSEACTIPAT